MRSPVEMLAASMMPQMAQQPARPLIEAQYMELRQRFDRYSQDHVFEPGMFVREKPGLAVFRTAIPIAWIVLRRFDARCEADKLSARKIMDERTRTWVTWRLDWVCASVTDDGVTLEQHVFDKRQIEPVPLELIPEEAR